MGGHPGFGSQGAAGCSGRRSLTSGSGQGSPGEPWLRPWSFGAADEPAGYAADSTGPLPPPDPETSAVGPAPGDRGRGGPAGGHGRRRRERSLFRELPLLIVAALVIAVVIKTFVVQAFVIPSGSMQNTLAIGDKILVNKLVYDFRPIHPGDIVVFNGAGSWNAPAPVDQPGTNLIARAYDDTLRKVFDAVGGLFGTPIGQTDYVKRVIGVPGDHVVCCNAQGLITVNGVALHEQSYLYPGNQSGSHPPGIPGRFNVRVPAGYLWVLGDHRGISDDSRGHEADPGNGMIPEDQVIGRAFLIVWPPSQWRVLPIPSTFEQPGIIRTASAAGQAASPAVAGLVGAVPLVLIRRRYATRKVRRRLSGRARS